MKIVVMGGSGLIGSKTVALLTAAGHDVIAASPDTGVNSVTGEGLGAALVGADVVVDLVNSRSFEPSAVVEFFSSHEKNLIAAEKHAGVKHHVVLSIVGTDRSPDNGYFRVKVLQEDAIKGSGIPYTIVRSTQFMEFIGTIADTGQKDNVVYAATGLFQPIAAADVASIVAEVAQSDPLNGTFDIAGPERAPLNEIIAGYLRELGDERRVQSDPEARYFGGKVEQLSLVPLGEARLGRTTLADWIKSRHAS